MNTCGCVRRDITDFWALLPLHPLSLQEWLKKLALGLYIRFQTLLLLRFVVSLLQIVFEVLWLLLRVFLILPDWWQLFYHLILTPCSWIEVIIPKRYAVLKQFYIRWKNSFVGQEFLNVTKIWYGSSWIQSPESFFKPHTHFSNFIKVQVIGECGVNFRTKIILFDWNYLLICCSWIKDRASLAS